jgi:hypothetical protein
VVYKVPRAECTAYAMSRQLATEGKHATSVETGASMSLVVRFGNVSLERLDLALESIGASKHASPPSTASPGEMPSRQGTVLTFTGPLSDVNVEGNSALRNIGCQYPREFMPFSSFTVVRVLQWQTRVCPRRAALARVCPRRAAVPRVPKRVCPRRAALPKGPGSAAGSRKTPATKGRRGSAPSVAKHATAN